MKKQQRLIDANALKRWLETNKANANPLDYNTKATYAECITMVEAMETIDAVPVVRCGECKHRNKRFSCSGRRDDWFCPNGERRSDNDTP